MTGEARASVAGGEPVKREMSGALMDAWRPLVKQSP